MSLTSWLPFRPEFPFELLHGLYHRPFSLTPHVRKPDLLHQLRHLHSIDAMPLDAVELRGGMEALGFRAEVLEVCQHDAAAGGEAAERSLQNGLEVGDVVEDEMGGDEVEFLAWAIWVLIVRCWKIGILGILEQNADGEDVLRRILFLEFLLEDVYHALCCIYCNDTVDVWCHEERQDTRPAADLEDLFCSPLQFAELGDDFSLGFAGGFLDEWSEAWVRCWTLNCTGNQG